jgi:hypothetical protein
VALSLGHELIGPDPLAGCHSTWAAPMHVHQMPAKANSGRLLSSANQVQTFRPLTGSAASVGSQKEVAGIKHRDSGFSQRRQCGEAIQPNEHQSVQGPENKSLRGLAPQHIDLLSENQDFRLKPRP